MRIKHWTTIPGTPRSSFGHALNDGVLYIAGGHPGEFHKYKPQNFSSEFHAFDLQSETWKELCPLPISLQGFRLVPYQDHLYAFGGFTPDERINPSAWPAASSDRILRYSILSGVWEDIGAMPRRRSSYVCAALGTKVYLIGGWDATPNEFGDKLGRFIKAIDVFHFPTKSFIPSCLEFPQVPLRRALSATVLNGRIIVAGGLGAQGFMLSDMFADVIAFTPPQSEMELAPLKPGCEECEKCNPAPRRYLQGDWKQLPFLPSPLFSPGIGAWGNDLIVAGGAQPLLPPSYGLSTKSIKIFRENAEGWTNLDVSMGEGKSFVEVQMISESSLALIGGHHGQETDSLPSTTIELLSRE